MEIIYTMLNNSGITLPVNPFPLVRLLGIARGAKLGER